MKSPHSLTSILDAAKNVWKPALLAGALAITPALARAQTTLTNNTVQSGSAGATVVGVATTPTSNYIVDQYLTTGITKPDNQNQTAIYGNADLGNIVAAGSYDATSHLELGVNAGVSTLYRVNNPDGQILDSWNFGSTIFNGVTSKVAGKTYLSQADGSVASFDFASTLVDTGRSIGAGRILADAYTLQGNSTPRLLAVSGYDVFDFGSDGSHINYAASNSIVGSFADVVLDSNENLTPGSAQKIWGAYNSSGAGWIAGFDGFSSAAVPEPATCTGLAGSAALLAAAALRRRKQPSVETEKPYRK
ncbi:MAG: hypothetical protein WC661_01335 [Opitutaceae bacterium]|jgi:hypothetical protein